MVSTSPLATAAVQQQQAQQRELARASRQLEQYEDTWVTGECCTGRPWLAQQYGMGGPILTRKRPPRARPALRCCAQLLATAGLVPCLPAPLPAAQCLGSARTTCRWCCASLASAATSSSLAPLGRAPASTGCTSTLRCAAAAFAPVQLFVGLVLAEVPGACLLPPYLDAGVAVPEVVQLRMLRTPQLRPPLTPSKHLPTALPCPLAEQVRRAACAAALGRPAVCKRDGGGDAAGAAAPRRRGALPRGGRQRRGGRCRRLRHALPQAPRHAALRHRREQRAGAVPPAGQALSVPGGFVLIGMG